jgi:polyisoprenoid-binding protein YceI
MSTATSVPGYIAGTWNIDPVHSDISFTIRHLMVSKVRGRFATFEGQIVTTPDPLQSTVTVSVDLSSIDTGNEQRDGHIRSADFFDTEANKTMTFRSTAVRPKGDDYELDGELTLRGITKPVTFVVEANGFGPDPFGGTRAGFSATGEVSRKDFGVDMDMPLEGGGVVIGDKVKVHVEIEAILDTPAAS